MEWHVNQAKKLLAEMWKKEQTIGRMEGSFVVQYAFYTSDFKQVEHLAEELLHREYEVAHGTMDEEFLAPYEAEVEQKKKQVRQIISISEQAEKMLEEGNQLLGKLQKILLELGLSREYTDYVYQQVQEERRLGKAEKPDAKGEVAIQEKEEEQITFSDKGGDRKCQI